MRNSCGVRPVTQGHTEPRKLFLSCVYVWRHPSLLDLHPLGLAQTLCSMCLSPPSSSEGQRGAPPGCGCDRSSLSLGGEGIGHQQKR